MDSSLKKKAKYLMISDEVVSSEKVFVETMEVCLLVWVRPLQEKKGIIDAATHQSLFSNIETLYNFNSKLLSDLQSDLKSHPNGGRKIGGIFKAFAPFFKMFTMYLEGFEKALALLKELQSKNAAFAEFATHAQNDPRLKGMPLMSFLITPVQRVPRYKLLLEDLLKAMPEEEEDKGDLKEALELVSKSAKHNNEAIRRRENQEKILEIQMSFAEGTKLNLLDNPGREFVKTGNLTKDHTFWLCSDLLIYGDKRVAGGYKVNREISLIKCMVSCPSEEECKRAGEDEAGGGLSMACMISIQSDAKSFVCYTESKEERKDWLEKIENSINRVRKQYESETGKMAAIWKPDSTTPACTSCGKKFTWTVRRHHCRNCGSVICGECSGGRVMLEHIDKKYKVRVCDNCMGALERGEGEGRGWDGRREEEIIKHLRLEEKGKERGKEPGYEPPVCVWGRGDAKFKVPWWAVVAQNATRGAVEEDLKMMKMTPNAPAPAATLPPPPPIAEVAPVLPVAAASNPPSKPLKPPRKPARPSKTSAAVVQESVTPVVQEPVSKGPVVPKRPSRFSRAVNNANAETEAAPSAAANPLARAGTTYGLSKLAVPVSSLPPGVDPKRREMFMNDLDFLQAFGMTKGKWEGMSEWKRNNLKKGKGLF